MVTVAAALLLLGAQAGPVQAAKGARPAPWGDLFGAGPPRAQAGQRYRAAVPLPRPRPADAPAAEAGSPRRAAGGPEAAKPAEQAAPAPQPRAAALGLPAGADGRDRHRPQHSRHPWRRRLRRRGSGAARGDRAAGQAAGLGEAGGDPALRDGVRVGRLDPHRYRAAGGKPRQHDLPISTISTRSNAAAATASSVRIFPNMAAPMRSTSAPSSSPMAARSR